MREIVPGHSRETRPAVLLNLATGEQRRGLCVLVRAECGARHVPTVPYKGKVETLDGRDWDEEHESDAPLEMTLDDGRQFCIEPPIAANGEFQAWLD